MIMQWICFFILKHLKQHYLPYLENMNFRNRVSRILTVFWPRNVLRRRCWKITLIAHNNKLVLAITNRATAGRLTFRLSRDSPNSEQPHWYCVWQARYSYYCCTKNNVITEEFFFLSIIIWIRGWQNWKFEP